MANEVAMSVALDDSVVVSNITVVCGRSVADCDDQVDPLFETNDNDPSNIGDDSVEERFRVDRRKLEQLIQGGTPHWYAYVIRVLGRAADIAR